jgi:aminomethyltransferase
VIRRSHFGYAGAEIIAPRKSLVQLWENLLALVRLRGGQPIGMKALEALRLEAGIPFYPADFNDTVIPQEAAVEGTHISFTKGCYTGQEIVERVRSRGQVNRQRIGLLFASGTQSVPPAGAPLTLDGAEAGYVTRAAKSFYPPAILAMGYARRESAGVGTVLDCSGGRASVVNLPITGQPHQPV